jgi:predicted Zn-dependent protease
MNMRWMKWLAAGFGLAAVLVSAGCQTATEPFTGRKQYLMSMSAQEECKLGLDAWTETLKTTPVSTNAQMNAAVQRVGKAIQAVASGPTTTEYQWEFKVLASKEANAFCLPGGKVAVYEGLFAYAKNDAELAAVIGHEVGHAVARHGVERMTEQQTAGYVGAALDAVLQAKKVASRETVMQAFGLGAQVGVLLPFSRVQEYAADQIGLMYMAKAGYNPQASLDFWQRFAAANAAQKSPFSDWLSTHPLDDKRIANMKQLMTKATVEYGVAPAKKGYGTSWK